MKKPFVLWLTGLSGSGKTTLAEALNSKLGDMVTHLDGDIVRNGLCSDLGFSKEDRLENIRRIAHVAKLFNDNNKSTIVTFITPFQEMRSMAKTIIGPEAFIETYIKCSIDKCEERDVKGLYKKARAGEITNFTGIHQPYEPPTNPNITINTETFDIQSSVSKVLYYLFQNSFYDEIL